MIFLMVLRGLIEFYDILLLNMNDTLANAENTLDNPIVELGSACHY